MTRDRDAQIAHEAEANLRAYESHGALDMDEAGWERVWAGLYSILCDRKRRVAEAFGFDPRRSKLYGEFPELLGHACDPQVPIVYSPGLREFGLMVFDGGPAIQEIRFDLFGGGALPGSLRDRWYDDLEALGIDPRGEDPLPAEYETEAWWVSRGL